MNLSQSELAIIRHILSKLFAELKMQVFVFGSRSNNSNNKASDLDLLLKSAAVIDPALIEKLKEAFEESNLKFKVDILDYNRVDEKFLQSISDGLLELKVN
ncbi:MAG: nucleotidyltransferase domain-containing protein [Pseudomonadota bacterium]